MQHRIVFMGTPEFALPALRVIARRSDRDGILVVTQPDRPSGRGRKLQSPPVRVAAAELNLDVEQVRTLKDPDVRDQLEAFAPDLIVVAAFGLILPKWVLRLPAQGCVNIHASELPRFRGASPVAAAIACGDSHAGVALMQMEAGLDTGDVYALGSVPIGPGDTTDSLTATLAEVGASLLDRHLDALLAGDMTPEPQSGEVVETRKITKAHGAIDWGRSAAHIERHIRAMWPWPRAWTVAPGDLRVQVHEAEIVEGIAQDGPGTITGNDKGVLVATGDGLLKLGRVQLPGKSAQHASDLGRHPAFEVGSHFELSDEFVPPEPWIVPKGSV